VAKFERFNEASYNRAYTADGAVTTEYQDWLEPLKFATERLERCGKPGNFGAIHEVIPVFKYVLSGLEIYTLTYE
jgi:hypothetical protein